MLKPQLFGGAQSLGNPTLTFVTLPPPNSSPAVVFTCFVFSENSNGTTPGGHIYIYPLP
jgi:hypothetical protein